MSAFLNKLEIEFGADVVSLAGEKYLREPRGRYSSEPMPLLRPRSTEEVSKIVKFCNLNEIAIVPYAGGTGLVGGQVSETNLRPTLLLSVERLNQVRGLYEQENVIVVEAGAILQDVQSAADDVDRLFPLSLAAQGSCRIGGNLATNAGGVQVLRYGNTRDLCLGLEAVLPDGTIHHGLKRLRKDNTGYDLRHLLIGSEGTLGIITAASLKLFAKPQETSTALIAIKSPQAAVDLFQDLQSSLGGTISAFELIHEQGYHFLAEKMPSVRLPFSDVPEWTILLEATGGEGFNLSDRLVNALEKPIENDVVQDALIAQTMAQAQEFWDLRENIPEANRLIGAVSSHDISIPISTIPNFIEKTPELLERFGSIRINCFGHLGDGNLHYNVFPAKGHDRSEYVEHRDEIKRVIHDQVASLEGSVSAEHGVGRLKVKDLERYGDPAKLAAMRAIKSALDPLNIMNPGVILAEK